MAVSKITTPPTQKEAIDKINEIIDNMGGTIVVDQTYDGTSVNPQSGVAIAGAKFLQNTATGTNSISVDGTPTSSNYSINLGYNSHVNNDYSIVMGSTAFANNTFDVAIGYGSQVKGDTSVAIGGDSKIDSNYCIAIGNAAGCKASFSSAIGYLAKVDTGANNSIQLGYGTNSTANSLSVGFYLNGNYQLLDGTTGLIPYQRINSLTETRNSDQLKFWTGTKAQYDAIAVKDSNTLYNITDDVNVALTLLDALYPIGALYFGKMSTCPLATLGVGTWQLVAQDKVIQGAGTRGSVGDTLDESLPNIKGDFQITSINSGTITNGAFSHVGGSTSNASQAYTNLSTKISLNANNSSSTYQDNAPVQQDAYLVNVWERIA